jgi:hypothetical protein
VKRRSFGSFSFTYKCYGVIVPLIIVTGMEHAILQDILEIHLDGLKVAKQTIIDEEDHDYLLEAVAAVDEAIGFTERLIRRVQHGC